VPKNVIYARVSSVAQQADRQISELKEVCQKNGWNNPLVIKDTISGYSKSTSERTGFSRLRKLIETGKVQNIVVSEISRIARRIADTAYFVDECTSRGINIHIANIGHHTIIEGKPNPMNSMITGILSSIAQMESETLKARVKSGIQEARRNGLVYKGRKKGAVCSREKILKRYSGLRGLFPAIQSGRMSLRELNKQYGLSINTIRKLKTMITE